MSSPLTRTRLVAATLAAASLGLAACSSDGSPLAASKDPVGGKDASASSSPTPEPLATISTNLPKQGTVPVSRTVKLNADQGTFKTVSVRAKGKQGGPLRGSMNGKGTAWKAEDALEPGLTYVVKATAVDKQGLTTRQRMRFKSDPLSLDQQTYPSIAPVDGQTVGVGMPVIVNFDIPVARKKAFERHMSVTTSPSQKGSWHWISDSSAHWRPKHYWKPGTKVDVNVDVNSLKAGPNLWGQTDNAASFTIGDRVINKVNLQTDQLRHIVNGKVERTIPITGGKPGFETRSGVKVIVEKFRKIDMDTATTGVSESDPEYYDLSDVEYAMRVTFSGEFLHAAPWSVGSQGYANVSHGCVGMSTSEAGWLFDHSIVGDVVDVTGSNRPMTLDNGYGDWNMSWSDWKSGSALN